MSAFLEEAKSVLFIIFGVLIVIVSTIVKMRSGSLPDFKEIKQLGDEHMKKIKAQTDLQVQSRMTELCSNDSRFKRVKLNISKSDYIIQYYDDKLRQFFIERYAFEDGGKRNDEESDSLPNTDGNSES